MVAAGVGVTGNGAGMLDHEIGKVVGQQRLVAPRHFGLVRRLDFECSGAFANRVGVDAGDGRDVRGARGSDARFAHCQAGEQKQSAPESLRGAKLISFRVP